MSDNKPIPGGCSRRPGDMKYAGVPKSPFDPPRNPNLTNLMNAELTQDAEIAKLREAEKAQAAKAALYARVENDFKYHPPKGDQIERYAMIRQKALNMARIMVDNCPVSRELSTALTHLESAVMSANAAIARNE